MVKILVLAPQSPPIYDKCSTEKDIRPCGPNCALTDVTCSLSTHAQPPKREVRDCGFDLTVPCKIDDKIVYSVDTLQQTYLRQCGLTPLPNYCHGRNEPRHVPHCSQLLEYPCKAPTRMDADRFLTSAGPNLHAQLGETAEYALINTDFIAVYGTAHWNAYKQRYTSTFAEVLDSKASDIIERPDDYPDFYQ